MRRSHVLAASLGLLALVSLAAPVMAGGWATAALDEGTPPSPNAGEQVEVGFTVRQHGATLIDWEHPTVLAINRESGEAIYADARQSGPTGHYVAELTFPSAGTWEWEIRLRDLAMETRLEPLTVRPGSVPQANAPDAAATASDASQSAISSVSPAVGAGLFVGGALLGALSMLAGSFVLSRRGATGTPQVATR